MFSVLAYILAVPVHVFARGAEGAYGQTDSTKTGLQFQIDSPLRREIFSLETLLTAVLNVLLVLAVPIIVFFLILAGFNYVTAQGNPEKIKTATRSLTYAIIGAVLILGGVAISEIIESVVRSFQN